MTQLLDFDADPQSEVAHLPTSLPVLVTDSTSSLQAKSAAARTSPSPAQSLAAELAQFSNELIADLEANPMRLLTLNPSRRSAVALRLEKLAGQVGTSPSQRGTGAEASSDHGFDLRRWIEGTPTETQFRALRSFFEEIAVLTIGQALVLKKWSDTGIRPWCRQDLSRLNWTLCSALKPFVPLDRDGWQITRPNLYSWYPLSVPLQNRLAQLLEGISLQEEKSGLLSQCIKQIRRKGLAVQEPSGYDPRFFDASWRMLWGSLSLPEEQSSSFFKRNKTFFTPTLRDGEILRTGPVDYQWIALEQSPFQSLVAEIYMLWSCPKPPPLWACGNGLEAHSRDQLSFSLQSGSQPKSALQAKIAEMEACDAAFVFEEQVIRTHGQGKTLESQLLKDQLENLPYFKKIRSGTSSLGILQACVAIAKLRMGGFLFWAREEPIHQKEGNEAVNFLLDRSKLLCEWDFSSLQHHLPTPLPLFPKFLYLFQRESVLETRLAHRPVRMSAQGHLKSHIEVSIFLEDALSGLFKQPTARENWRIFHQLSPTPQREWQEKWPDPTSNLLAKELDSLRAASSPLAQIGTVRPTPDGSSDPSGGWSVSASLKGFWISASHSQSEGRKILAHPLPRPHELAHGQGYLVLYENDLWGTPLMAYFRSASVRNWLDHHAERRGGRWILNEQVMKWIPIPKSLLRILEISHSSGSITQAPEGSPWGALFSHAIPAPFETFARLRQFVADAIHHPRETSALLKSGIGGPGEVLLGSVLFKEVSEQIEYLLKAQHRLFSLVNENGKINWSALLKILPKAECMPISTHPKIRLTGTLPSHIPIGKIDMVRHPQPGILLSTESGFSLHIAAQPPLLIKILSDQLEGLTQPTWSELVQFLQVPRQVEVAESTALEILNSYQEQVTHLKDLRELLDNCKLF